MSSILFDLYRQSNSIDGLNSIKFDCVRLHVPNVRLDTPGDLHGGVANGLCETLRGGETSVFLCEPETLIYFEMRVRDFGVISEMRVQDLCS